MKNLFNPFNLFTVKNAYAASAASSGQGGWEGTLWSFAPLIAIVVIFYLLVILPQQKRTKDHKKMIDSLKVGDEILTNGGIYGIISGIADQVFTIEIAKDVKIKIAKNAIATKTSKS
ncbi:MAG: preprotein translocase subunit YajC [Deltaproteobacteria bacterium]|jgi:preprotein translocase subunit YajC|nr:preprotein translocase subunit YajC [Deltaproteobacteria bacterium]MCL5893171.1 preprotein translocase subunit YajC [Deltaproteobacteria bacterium]MDA8273633.1 preprotein translocase subunit YajC [Deltaproteobacteria bacterium]